MCFIVFIVMNVILVIFSLENYVMGSNNVYNKQIKPLRSIKLPACQACKMLVQSFYTRMRVVESDVVGEQERVLRNYTNFIYIYDQLCEEEHSKDQCNSLADKFKAELLEWWLTDETSAMDLFPYLCINKHHYCCPNGHYGPECKPCPGYPDLVCYNNGKCKGNGTRKGNGLCACDVGYSGTTCGECAASYYVSYKDQNKLLCVRCHAACDGSCSGPGAHSCISCREGWRKIKSKGCIDVNECFTNRSPCKRNEFCVNNEGSYSCLACDASCDTCKGDGPDMCENCAPGFFLEDNICVNEKKYVSYSDVTRYLTYLGLCFATYIVFQNSPWVASIIGICVAIYVTVTEYMLGTLTLSKFMPFSNSMEVIENLWR